jgi:hypothetical protein
MARAAQMRDVVGAPEEIRNMLERAHADGRLVSFTEPERVVRVRVVLREQPSRPAHSSRWNPLDNPAPYLIATVVVAMAGIAAVVAYEVVKTVTAAVAWISGHAMSTGAGVLLIALFIALGGGTAACTGIHCGGCR